MTTRPSRTKLLPPIASLVGTEILAATQAAGAEGAVTVVQIASAVAAILAGPTLTEPTANRIYQRDTTTGGAFSLGAGAVGISVTLSAAATLLEYQLRDALNPTNVLVSWTTLATNPLAGATNYSPAIPAGPHRYLMDVRANGYSGNAVTGTQSFGVGEVICAAGQSLAVTMFSPNTDTTTNATLGVTTDPTCSVLASIQNVTHAWGLPGDGTNYTSTFASKFCKELAAAAGVVVGLTGYGYGAQPISFFGSSNLNFATLINSVGKFRTFVWNHGHADSSAGTTQATYLTALTSLLTWVDSLNTFAGAKLKVLQPIPNIGASYPAAGNNTIRNAMASYATSNPSTTTLQITDDLQLNPDGVHPNQTGEVRHAIHTVRAMKKLLGLDATGDAGPTITTASRTSGSAVISLAVTHAGGTDLVASGTASSMFKVFNSGDTSTPLTISGVARTGTAQLQVTLSAAPSDTQALGVWCGYGYQSADQSTNGVWDNNTGDGYPVGRNLTVSLAEMTVAAPASAVAPNAPTLALGSATANSLVLTLTAAGTGGTPQSYTAQRALDSGFATGLTTINGGSPITYTASPMTFTDTGLSASTAYYYRATATNGSGTSGQSATASGTTAANSITVTGVSPLTAGSTATVSGTFAGGTPTGFTYSLDSGSAVTVSSPTIGSGTFSFTITNPAAGAHTISVTGTGGNTATSSTYSFSTSSGSGYLSSLPTVAAASSGPLVAYDASLLTGTTGSSVATLPDQSGNGADVSQGTSGNQPTLTTVNSLNALRFTAASHQLLTASASSLLTGLNTSDLTILMVCRPKSVTSGQYGSFYIGDSAGANSVFEWDSWTSTTDTFFGREKASSNVYAPSGASTCAVATNAVGKHVHRYTASSGAMTHYTGGTEATGTSTTNATAWTTIIVGAASPTANWGDVDFCEFVVWNGRATDTERNAIYSYANTKWGS